MFNLGLIQRALPVIDILIAPFVFISSYLFKFIRIKGVANMKIAKKIFIKVGIYPIKDHYYEPLFNPAHLYKSLREDRVLPWIDFNVKEQLNMLKNFNYNDELIKIPMDKNDKNSIQSQKEYSFFYYNNYHFEYGDSEYLYNTIRFLKPKQIIEVGCGYSTLLMLEAIKQNKQENPNYQCKQVCIEPYEKPWLEELDIKITRERLEKLDSSIFNTLEKNDILFIDSSHIIRAQGDVLLIYLTILPMLKKGVYVHIHDIFTPKDYLDNWILEHHYPFWNEQYLVEAFLGMNKEYKIIGALNFLKHNYFKELSEKCPTLKQVPHDEPRSEPRSLWIVRK